MTEEAVPPTGEDDPTGPTRRPDPPRAGADVLPVVGVAFALVGLGALICAFGPFFFAFGDEPLWLASAAFLLPLGAALLAWSARRDAGRPRPPDPAGAPSPPAS